LFAFGSVWVLVKFLKKVFGSVWVLGLPGFGLVRVLGNVRFTFSYKIASNCGTPTRHFGP